LGFDRTDSTKISFYLSIPALVGASALGIKDLFKENIDFNLLVVVGVFLSFLFSLLTIKIFLRFIKNFSLNIFVVYRLFLAIVLFYIIYF
jgi:undecaprenyl-diphosphatase